MPGRSGRPLVVLGIDPGTATTGWGVVESSNNLMRLLDCGYISTPAKMEHAKRLKMIYDEISAIIDRFNPDEAGIERLYFYANAKTAMDVSEARGVLMLATVTMGVETFSYTPLEVKQAITGYGKAKKAQVGEMVRLLLNLHDIPKPDDTADAIAVAICHINRNSPLLQIK
ncbi:MAG: Holliday junction resolvase [Candidatus Syntrophoarchaeum caldarius]|uniref:Holliday junction resolvase n=1 Tax=Candidatus Syntropharchaeum caldarium TaxID=1838285 RepID=A0A1F2PA84_9EURY|nr:MAG: Holliday junction resolvase [Candidatus Syntrophoarchaeum caldarius]